MKHGIWKCWFQHQWMGDFRCFWSMLMGIQWASYEPVAYLKWWQLSACEHHVNPPWFWEVCLWRSRTSNNPMTSPTIGCFRVNMSKCGFVDTLRLRHNAMACHGIMVPLAGVVGSSKGLQQRLCTQAPMEDPRQHLASHPKVFFVSNLRLKSYWLKCMCHSRKIWHTSKVRNDYWSIAYMDLS